MILHPLGPLTQEQFLIVLNPKYQLQILVNEYLQSAKQDHVRIIEMSDFSARVEQMDQTDKWSLDPSAVNSEL